MRKGNIRFVELMRAASLLAKTWDGGNHTLGKVPRKMMWFC